MVSGPLCQNSLCLDNTTKVKRLLKDLIIPRKINCFMQSNVLLNVSYKGEERGANNIRFCCCSTPNCNQNILWNPEHIISAQDKNLDEVNLDPEKDFGMLALIGLSVVCGVIIMTLLSLLVIHTLTTLISRSRSVISPIVKSFLH